MISSEVSPSWDWYKEYSGVAKFAPTSKVKITMPARTRRAVVEASQPLGLTAAADIRSSLKTVIFMPFLVPDHLILVGSGACRADLIAT